MTKEQLNVKEFMLAAGQDCPVAPTIPPDDVRKLRIKLILEELLELADASGYDLMVTAKDSTGFIKTKLEIDKIEFEPAGEPDIVEVADGCCDLLFVVFGSGLAYGLDLEPLFNEVSSSNATKFLDGFRREDGKWQKGPSYRPANLAPIIEKQK